MLVAKDGKDGVGVFHLKGTVDKCSGDVDMKKEYVSMGLVSTVWWHCRGALTRFGIVDNWGQARWGGWLWMWKAKWTEGKA